MTGTIKAIETSYRGHRFRSRTEARWAVFFWNLGIPYEYEHQGYDLDGELYLPDFWMPDPFNFFFEVKGVEPTEQEMKRAELLAVHSTHNVLIGVGNPKNNEDQIIFFPSYLARTYRERYLKPYFSDSLGMALLKVHFFKSTDNCLCVGTIPSKKGRSLSAQKITGYSTYTAYEAASGARFEHGESLPDQPPTDWDAIKKETDEEHKRRMQEAVLYVTRGADE